MRTRTPKNTTVADYAAGMTSKRVKAKSSPTQWDKIQAAKPLDWGKVFADLQYVQQDKHDGAALHRKADGSWLVIPTIRVYSPADDGKAEQMARAFFESLRGEPLDETDRFDGGKSQSYEFPNRQANSSGAQWMRKEPSNSAIKAPGRGRTRAGALDKELNR